MTNIISEPLTTDALSACMDKGALLPRAAEEYITLYDDDRIEVHGPRGQVYLGYDRTEAVAAFNEAWAPSVEHTPEPWKAENEHDIVGGRDYIATLAYTTAEDKIAANAHRICAAVNATVGIPTEALESGIIQRQREALLAALEYFIDYRDHSCFDGDTRNCEGCPVCSVLIPQIEAVLKDGAA